MAVTLKKKDVTKPAAASKLTFMQKVIKSDTYMVMAQSGLEPEDEFAGLYWTTQDSNKTFLQPPFDPKVLANMVYQNNVLSQCLDAMEVNIDGTGHEFVAAEEGKEIDANELKKAKGFFDEPYPGQSFVSLRRTLRRDLEGIGYGYFEILRNMAGEIVGIRTLPSYMIRLIKLDNPIKVKRKVIRNGEEIELEMWERERRFAQRLKSNFTRYFREFGSSRQVNVDTGEWETKDKPIPKEKQATELMMFSMNPDVSTPYAVPRWINQLPSVVGSRKAEEQNLEFFDAGGIPPAIIFIQGGTLAKDMSDQLKMYLSGQTKSRNRAVVVEAQSSSGSLESAGTVQVKVERFGSERANDAMFSKYDKDAEEHVRTGFRLPPLFLGKAADYNFATAKTAYMVAEAQVFEPERVEFDERMNRTILRELGLKTLKFKSNPITLKDVDMQLKAMELISDKVEPEGLVGEVNKIAGVTLTHQEQEDPNVAMERDITKLRKTKEVEQEFSSPQEPQRLTVPEGHKVIEFPQGGKARTIKYDASGILRLSEAYMVAEGLLESDSMISDDERTTIQKEVDELRGGDSEAFWGMVSLRTFGREDMIELLQHEPHD